MSFKDSLSLLFPHSSWSRVTCRQKSLRVKNYILYLRNWKLGEYKVQQERIFSESFCYVIVASLKKLFHFFYDLFMTAEEV